MIRWRNSCWFRRKLFAASSACSLCSHSSCSAAPARASSFPQIPFKRSRQPCCGPTQGRRHSAGYLYLCRSFAHRRRYAGHRHYHPTWASSNTSDVTVSSAGVLTAGSAPSGNTTVTATDGGVVSNRCAVVLYLGTAPTTLSVQSQSAVFHLPRVQPFRHCIRQFSR